MNDGTARAPESELAAVEAVLRRVLPLVRATPEAVQAMRQEKLDALLGFVARHVPYYAELGLPLAPRLEDFPPTDKAALMLGLPRTCAPPGPTLAALRELVAADERLSSTLLFDGRSLVVRSSGTTGFIGYYLWDESMAEVAEASATRFVPAPANLPKPVLAVAPVVSWQPLRGVLEGLHSVPFGAGLHGTIDRLHALKPRTILGSTGFVVALADEQIAGRLRAQPEVVVIGAEQCTALQWQRIIQAWGVTPMSQYGLSEAGLIASHCAAGNWHVHADSVILELLDDAGHPVPEGQRCARALLTRLFGPNQPLVRYELGDVLVQGPTACPCRAPFPTLAAIEGRRRAILWLRGDNGDAREVSASVVIHTLETTPGLLRYQIIYERPGHIEIRTLAESGLDEATLRGRIQAAVRRHGAVPPAVDIRPGGLPDVWAAPSGTKDHHVRLTVTREQVLATLERSSDAAHASGRRAPS